VTVEGGRGEKRGRFKGFDGFITEVGGDGFLTSVVVAFKKRHEELEGTFVSVMSEA
jgi:hypothetical protein